MSAPTPGWVHRFLVGIAICLVATIYLSYQVLMSGIPLWDKVFIFLIQFLCIAGLIWGFLYYYAKYRGIRTKLDSRIVYIAIIPPLIVLGMISAYLIIPPFFNSISLSNNTLPSALAKIIAFIAIAIIGISSFFRPRR